MANLLDRIIDYLADAVVKDSNGNATIEGDLTVGGHSSPIGSQGTGESASGSGISIASGGSLKATGISITLDPGVWIISYYGSFGSNPTNSLYKGLALRYRNVGETSWNTWGTSQITVGAWGQSTEVAPSISTCVVDAPPAQREYELEARCNPSATFSGRLVAFRIA